MEKLFSDYESNKKKFEEDFKDCSDFLLREGEVCGVKCFFAVMDGLVDSLQLTQMIVSPILKREAGFDTKKELFDEIKLKIVNSVEMNEAESFEDCYYFLMSGFCVFVLDGVDTALACGIQGWEKRSIDEPSNENNVKGAKECFTETLNDNKALIRKRLKSHHLKLKQLKLGTAAKTAVVIGYVDNRADGELVRAVEERLYKANFNTVADYGELVPFVDTDIKTFFSSVGNTERPDVAVSKLLEGRIVILVDGTPFAIFLPALFSDSFQSVDDYDNPPFYSGFIRVLRYFSFVLSIFLPGMYVAIGTFHQELIPTGLLFSIASEEITTPFSLMTEAIMLLVLYEIMREAGLRLPKAIGHAVSIIGGIIIGETTVTAGLIGAPMLVVIAMTAISSYVVYPLYESVSVLRFIFIIVGGLTGMYGLIIGGAVLFINICALNPFGVPYSSPISPLDFHSLGDIFYRESWKELSKRNVRVDRLRGADIDIENIYKNSKKK
ncbi:MAG: spore germination protein [Eubacteriales bacterium]|nr:spore germination protein [Eubacteriales bacterium]